MNPHTRPHQGPAAVQSTDAEVVTIVRVPPRWPNIRPIATHVEFCVTAWTYEERGKRAGVVVHELLENAVKYGDLSSNIEVEVRMPQPGMRFSIRVTNRASATRVQTLREEVERIAKQSPEQAFLEAIKRAGGRPSGNSMIGLARISHEGEVTLLVEEAQGMVTVIAQG